MKKDKKRTMTRRDFIKHVGCTAGALGIASGFPKLLKPALAA